jgi:hypothetical protein
MSVRGQDVGWYRGMQGRRVGHVALPTPPFNPDAGILDSRRRRGHDSTKTSPRRSTRRGIKADNRNRAHGTPRRWEVRRGRIPHE